MAGALTRQTAACMLCDVRFEQERGVGLSERQASIVALLKEQNRLGVKELAQRFGVSEMTIRRDFRALEQRHRLTRTHGGGVETAHLSFDLFLGEKMGVRREQKIAIARRAAQQIEPGDCIMLDTGTTVFHLANYIDDIPDITVATPSLAVASNLFWKRTVRLIVLGGAAKPWSPDLVGTLTRENIRHLHFRKAFLGADGIDPAAGLFCNDLESANVIAEILNASDQVYVLADSSKLGARSLIKYADFNDIDAVITDTDNPVHAERLCQHIRVIQAGREKGANG
ncbi:MAG: DeoR family transcriptional regulator [Chitinivibrionales bacterium]|nr:DeoR family transcriptional regulator [Chitinivibrionales bacterium]